MNIIKNCSAVILPVTDKKANAAVRMIVTIDFTVSKYCMKLLLRQQPVAKDLRLISSALKMISDMERIGDQAADIAEITQYVSNETIFGKMHIKEMAVAVVQMVTDSINSFVKSDTNAAKCVIIEDDKVDELFIKVKDELISLITKSPEKGEYCIDIMMIAKYLERIGDHATNIAEWVEFSITGIHRHEGENI